MHEVRSSPATSRQAPKTPGGITEREQAILEKELPADLQPARFYAEPDEEEERPPLEEHLTKHVHATKAFLFASILLTLFIAVLSSITADGGVLHAIVGFAPTIISIGLFIFLLEGDYKDALYWLTPVTVSLAFLVLGQFLNPALQNQLDIPVLTGVNMVLSYLVLAIMTAIEYSFQPAPPTLDEEFKPEALPEYIHTIEDKCKAINFAIGRVYRDSNGGSADARAKLKVPREWYNEFNSLKPEELADRQSAARDLIAKIKDRLSVLLKPEKDVLSEAEVRSLKKIMRDTEGRDRVLDVLSVNDRDPVEEYYLGALDFCKKLGKELEGM